MWVPFFQGKFPSKFTSNNDFQSGIHFLKESKYIDTLTSRFLTGSLKGDLEGRIDVETRPIYFPFQKGKLRIDFLI